MDKPSFKLEDSVKLGLLSESELHSYVQLLTEAYKELDHYAGKLGTMFREESALHKLLIAEHRGLNDAFDATSLELKELQEKADEVERREKAIGDTEHALELAACVRKSAEEKVTNLMEAFKIFKGFKGA